MRKVISINRGWRFTGPDGSTVPVDLPHTWNAIDGQDGGNDYWRGTCVYEKTFPKPEFGADQRVYLEFQGVNASAWVEMNGKLVGEHDGGYSTFRWDVTDFLAEENALTVHADNSRNERVYPQKADFTFYGGIYRDVSLIIVNRNHFDMDHFGGPGLKITPAVSGKDGSVRVETFHKAEGASVAVRLLDGDGQVVAQGTGTDCALTIPGVRLWDGVKDPYLYRCEADLLVGGAVADQVSARFGVRTFSVDPEKGFFLNGRPYPLHGVSRHQDWKGIGNALTREHHDTDMAIIRELGANTIRLAHYQHDQYFYDLCDQYGMVVWAEIPYISSHMNAGRENTISQATELVVQNYNHPWEKDQPKYFGLSGGKQEKVKVSEYIQIIKANKPLQRLMVAGGGCKLALSIATNVSVLIMLYQCMMGNYDGLYLPMMVLGYVFAVPFFLLTVRTSQKKGQKASLTRYVAVAFVCYIGVLAILLLWKQGDPNFTFSIMGENGLSLNLYTVLFILFFGVGYGAYYATADMPIPMVADCADYETYRSGKFIPGIMGTLFSLVDKLVSSLSATVVGVACTIIGLESLPTKSTPYTAGMNVVVIVLFCVIPMVAWALTLWAMKGYELDGERVKTIQAVNGARKQAMAQGMSLERAMKEITDDTVKVS